MIVSQEAARNTSSDNSLQTGAQQVEQLRRQIAEITGKGQTVTPALLAQFARAQKSYLDRKIEFEKQKRNGSGIVAPPPAPAAPAAASPADSAPRHVAETSPAKPAPATSPVPIAKSPSTASPATLKTSPAGGSAKWIILTVLVVAAGVAAWLLLR